MSNLKEKFKNKKTIISILALTVSIILVLGVFIIKPLFDKSIEGSVKYYYNNIPQVVNYKPVGWDDTEENKFIYLCNYNNLTNPDILFAQDGENYSRIQYFQPVRNNLFSQTWSIDKYEGYKGYTLIYNLESFDNLKDLAKEDCNQFRKDKSLKQGDDPETTIYWDYRAPQTEEQKERVEYEAQKEEQEERDIYYGYTFLEIVEIVATFSEERQAEIKTQDGRDKQLEYMIEKGYLEPKE